MATAQRFLGDVGKFVKKSKEEKAAQTVSLSKEEAKKEKDRITVIFILVAFVIFFWAGFEQAGSTLSLYTDRYIDRHIGSWEMPTSWFQSVNPALIVLFAPFFTVLWMFLAKRKREPNIPVKMGMGMILLGLGFIVMIGAVLQRGGENPDPAVKASMIWLVGTYILHTMGELCLSPVGLSMITKLAPVRLASLLMGVWLLSSFVANFLSGFVVQYVEQLGAFNIFASIATLVIVLGLVMIALQGKLKAMMHGRD
jgi:POT family proton-dependent oligopeptide transporter